MRFILTTLLFSLSFNCFSQKRGDKIVGKYNDSFGCTLEINKDSTFKFRKHFDIYGSWNIGTWRIEKDTIFFKNIVVYDTLVLKGDSVSLIVSDDEQPNKVYKLHTSLKSGGQGYYPGPDKLIFGNNKLYYLRDGKINKKRVRGFWSKKKAPSWYVKQK